MGAVGFVQIGSTEFMGGPIGVLLIVDSSLVCDGKEATLFAWGFVDLRFCWVWVMHPLNVTGGGCRCFRTLS